MKIYTKRGDKGETDFGGKRVSKSSQEIEALGSIDELNSVIGLAISKSNAEDIKKYLLTIQNDLHIIASEIACVSKDHKILETDIQVMEANIDEIEEKLDPLNKFILPGGSENASLLHMARTVCRRAERNLARLDGHQDLKTYVNRLGDFLFVLARYANRLENVSESNPEY